MYGKDDEEHVGIMLRDVGLSIVPSLAGTLARQIPLPVFLASLVARGWVIGEHEPASLKCRAETVIKVSSQCDSRFLDIAEDNR